MAERSRIRPFRLWRYGRPLVRLLLLLLFLTLLLYLALPGLANSWLLPKLLQSLPMKTTLQMEHLTPAQLRLNGSFEAGVKAEFAGLTLRSPVSLLRRQRIRELNLAWLKLTLPLHTPASETEEAGGEPSITFPHLALPVGIDLLHLRNGELVLQDTKNPAASLHLLFSATVQPRWHATPDGLQLTALSGTLQLAGALPLSLQFQADATGRVELTGNLPSLEKLAQLPLPLPEGIQLKGAADIKVRAQLQKEGLPHWQATLQLDHTAAQLPGGVALGSARAGTTLALEGTGHTITTELNNMELQAPLPATITATGSYDLQSRHLQLDASGSSSFSDDPLQLQLELTQRGDRLPFSLQLQGKNARVNGVQLPSCELNLSGTSTQRGTTARLQVNLPEVILPEQKATLHGLTLEQPIQYPPPRRYSRSKGSLRIQAVRWNNTTMAALEATLTQTHSGLKSLTTVDSPLGNHLRLTCDSTVTGSPFSTETSCRLPWAEITLATLQQQLGFDLPEGLTASGSIGGRFHWQQDAKHQDGRLSLSLRDGQLHQGESAVSGIHTSLTIPHLSVLRSAPDQRLSVEKIDAGDIHLSNAKLRWQLESPQALFIEQVQAEWCGGTIESAAMRLTATPALETTIYCDRLNLGQLLTQLGVKGASGKVSLNGRLPVSFQQNRLQVNNGFLYSSPGAKMVLRFADTAVISNSLGAAAKTGYLAYSVDSLKNFACNWTTLTLASQDGGDDLLMQMQLDGAPAEPLPYAWRNGAIVPSQKGPGLTHPVHFDVNFHLPLQQLFRAGTGWQSMMNTFKETL